MNLNSESFKWQSVHTSRVTWMSSDDVIPLPTSALSEIMHSGKKSCRNKKFIKAWREIAPLEWIIRYDESKCDRVDTANTSCSLLTLIRTLESWQHAAGSVPLVSWRTRTWRSFCRKRTWCRLWGTRSPEPPAPPRGPLDTSLGTTLHVFVWKHYDKWNGVLVPFWETDRFSYPGRGWGAPPAAPSSPGHCSEPSGPTCDTHLWPSLTETPTQSGCDCPHQTP